MAEKPVEQFYLPPPKLGKWESFRIFLWNSETHQFLGRTGASWAKILIFYVLFYASLTGFFFAMLGIFYQTIDKRIPKWQLDESLIGSNPGLGFRPMPPADNVESTLIWYRHQAEDNNKNNYEFWTNQLNNFLKDYKRNASEPPSGNAKRTVCEFGRQRVEGTVCDVNSTSFGDCTSEKNYGYDVGKPCIFLKLNKIFNWIPSYFNGSMPLHPAMPESLQKHIEKLNETHFGTEAMNIVWVSCEGENPADVENIGHIEYLPSQGFAGYYFPFLNGEGYLSPLVAVRFQSPKHNVLINIECKAWAKNILHDRAERRGSVHFELMID